MIGVRPAEPGDVAALAELMSRQGDHQRTFDPLVRIAPDFDWRAFAARRLGRRDRRVLVAHRDGEIVGYAVFGTFVRGAVRSWIQRLALNLLPRLRGNRAFLLEPARYGLLDDLYVIAELHGHGVGAELYRQGRAWLAAQGVEHVEAVVAEGNQRTQAFNRKLGFETVRRVMRVRL